MAAGSLEAVAVLLREFVHRSGAARAVAVVEGFGGHDTAIVDVARLAPIEVTIGDRTLELPHDVTSDDDVLPVPDVRQLPAFDVNRAGGEIAGTIGGIEHLAGAIRGLAETLGGRSVAMAQFETTTPEIALSISARPEEPMVVAIGEDEYEMDEGWPPRQP